jgi:hypothetical protein
MSIADNPIISPSASASPPPVKSRFVSIAAQAVLVFFLAFGAIWLLYQRGFSQKVEPAKIAARDYLSAFATTPVSGSYRWTTSHSVVLLPPVGYPYQLTFRAASLRPASVQTTLSANRVPVAPVQISPGFETYTFRINQPYLGPAPVTLEFDTPATFRPDGAEQPIGIAIEWLEISALGPVLPPPLGWLSLSLAFAFFYGLLRLGGLNLLKTGLFSGALLAIMLALLADDFSGLLARGNLIPVAVLVTLAGLLICFRRRPFAVVLALVAWLTHALIFYYAPGASEPLAWRRIGYNWENLSIIFSGIPPTIWIPLFACLIALASGLVADWLLALIFRSNSAFWQSPGERLVIGVGLGLAGLTFVIFGLGVIGGLYSEILWTLVVILLAAGAFRLAMLKPWLAISKIREAGGVRILLPSSRSKMAFWLGFWLVFAVTCWIYTVQNLTPDFGYDAAWYHLTMARRFMEHHRLINVVGEYAIWPGGYPANQELLYTLAYGLLGQSSSLPQAFHWLNGLLVAATLYLFVRCILKMPSYVGATAALIFYATPLTATTGATSNNDLTLNFYFLLTCYCLFRYFDYRFAFVSANTKATSTWLVIAGIFAGYMGGIKYFGMFLAALLGLTLFVFLFSVAWRRERKVSVSILREPLTGVLLFGAIALLLVAPWLLRNWFDLKNPVYPVLSPLLFSDQWWDASAAKTFAGSMGNYGVGSHPGNFLALPWTLSTNIKSFDGSIGALYLMFSLPGIAMAFFEANKRLKTILLTLLCLVLVYTSVWFIQSQQLRYLFVVYPVLAIVAAYALWKPVWLLRTASSAGQTNLLTRLYRFSWHSLRLGLPTLLLLISLLNLPFFANLRRDYIEPHDYDYAFGRVNYQAVLDRRLPEQISWLNRKLPASARVALVYATRTEAYYYAVPALLPMLEGPPNADYRLGRPEYLNNPRAPENLKRLALSHIFIQANLRDALEKGTLAPYITLVDNYENKGFLYALSFP